MTQEEMDRRLDIIEEGLRLCDLCAHGRAKDSILLRVNTKFTGIDTTLGLGPDGEWIVLHGISPARIPTENHVRVAEVITRINQRYAIGGFDLSFARGEVRFRTGQMLMGDDPARELVCLFVGHMVQAWNTFYTPIMTVAYGNATPEAALAPTLPPAAQEPPAPTDDDDAGKSEPAADIDSVLRQLGLE